MKFPSNTRKTECGASLSPTRLTVRAAPFALFFSAITLLLPLSAQVTAPLLGYLPDGTRVHPVYGIPAAATVASPIRTGEDVGRAIAVRNSVLILEADEGEVSAFVSGTLKYIPGTGKAPDRIALSPTGQGAVLWFASNSTVQILSELAATPGLRQIDASFLGSSPAALAISDDGKWLAGAWQERTVAIGPNGEVLELPGISGAVTALEFFPGSHDLGLATARALWTIADVGGRTAPRLAWQMNPDDEGSLNAVAVAGGTGELYAATRSGTIHVIPLSADDSREPVQLQCECQPTALARMAANAFRLTGPVDNAIKLFDADMRAVLFAPLRPPDTTDRLGGRGR